MSNRIPSCLHSLCLDHLNKFNQQMANWWQEGEGESPRFLAKARRIDKQPVNRFKEPLLLFIEENWGRIMSSYGYNAKVRERPYSRSWLIYLISNQIGAWKFYMRKSYTKAACGLRKRNS